MDLPAAEGASAGVGLREDSFPVVARTGTAGHGSSHHPVQLAVGAHVWRTVRPSPKPTE